jgi:hypothetical protein
MIQNLPIFVVPWLNTIAKTKLYKKKIETISILVHNKIFSTAPAKVLTSDPELCSIAKAHYCMQEAAYKWDSEHSACLPMKSLTLNMIYSLFYKFLLQQQEANSNSIKFNINSILYIISLKFNSNSMPSATFKKMFIFFRQRH